MITVFNATFVEEGSDNLVEVRYRFIADGEVNIEGNESCLQFGVENKLGETEWEATEETYHLGFMIARLIHFGDTAKIRSVRTNAGLPNEIITYDLGKIDLRGPKSKR